MKEKLKMNNFRKERLKNRLLFADVLLIVGTMLVQQGPVLVNVPQTVGQVNGHKQGCPLEFHELDIPSHSLHWTIHTKDESKCETTFAFIFGVN